MDRLLPTQRRSFHGVRLSHSNWGCQDKCQTCDGNDRKLHLVVWFKGFVMFWFWMIGR